MIDVYIRHGVVQYLPSADGTMLGDVIGVVEDESFGDRISAVLK